MNRINLIGQLKPMGVEPQHFVISATNNTETTYLSIRIGHRIKESVNDSKGYLKNSGQNKFMLEFIYE